MDAANWQERNVKGNYLTEDIMDLVLETARDYAHQCATNAKKLGLKSDRDSLNRLWSWVKANVDYVEDGTDEWRRRCNALGIPIPSTPPQDVPTPNRALDQGFCDCKGMAVIVSGHLQCAGIPHKILFTSHYPNEPVHHVFVVADLQPGVQTPIDCTIGSFGVEALPIYTRKYFPMLRQINGVTRLNDGALTLQLYQERLELEKELARKAGISGVQEEYALALSDVDAAWRLIERGEYDAINGVGKIKVPPIIKKAAEGVKNGVDAAVKAVNDVQKKIAEEVIAILLPGASPFFLYLFAKQPELLSEKAREQRKKAEKVANFITDTLGMKDERFMQIVRNGIMKKAQKTPEQLIAEAVSRQGVNGIGIIPALAVIASEAVPVIMKLINALAEKFGKKKPIDNITAEDFPTGGEAAGSKASEIIETFAPDAAAKAAEKDASKDGNSGGGASDTQNKGTETTTSGIPKWVMWGGLGLLGLGLIYMIATSGKKKRRSISGARRRKKRKAASRPRRRRARVAATAIGAPRRKRRKTVKRKGTKRRTTTKRRTSVGKRKITRRAKKAGSGKKGKKAKKR